MKYVVDDRAMIMKNKKEKQIFNVAHQRHGACCSFFLISMVCTSFSTIFSLLLFVSCVHNRASKSVKKRKIRNELLRLIDAIITWETSITRCYMRYMHIKRHKHNTNQMLSDHIILYIDSLNCVFKRLSSKMIR